MISPSWWDFPLLVSITAYSWQFLLYSFIHSPLNRDISQESVLCFLVLLSGMLYPGDLIRGFNCHLKENHSEFCLLCWHFSWYLNPHSHCCSSSWILQTNTINKHLVNQTHHFLRSCFYSPICYHLSMHINSVEKSSYLPSVLQLVVTSCQLCLHMVPLNYASGLSCQPTSCPGHPLLPQAHLQYLLNTVPHARFSFQPFTHVSPQSLFYGNNPKWFPLLDKVQTLWPPLKPCLPHTFMHSLYATHAFNPVPKCTIKPPCLL